MSKQGMIDRPIVVKRKWVEEMAGFLAGHNFTVEHPEVAKQFFLQILHDLGVEVEKPKARKVDEKK